LKLKPLRLKAIVDKPKAVNQIPITGQAAKKKCNERELLKEAYWNSTKVTVSSYDVVSFFFLSKTVSSLADSFSVVSRIKDEVTKEPCIAENNEPQNSNT
jgi:hypothetical protein